jgi:Fic family protein
MPFFNGAKGVNISGGQMNDVARDLTNNVTVIKSHRVHSDNKSTSCANNNSSSGGTLSILLHVARGKYSFAAAPVTSGTISN